MTVRGVSTKTNRVSIEKTEFGVPPPFRDLDNFSLGASSTCFSHRANPSGYKAHSSGAIPECHSKDHIGDGLECLALARRGKCECHP